MLSAPGMLPGTSEGTSMRAPSMTRPAAVRRLPLLLAGLLALAGIGLAGSRDTAAGAAAPPLMVGVGRADITPPTGHYFQGWVESSAVGTGVNTRIYARAIVLQEGSQKYALVAEDMNGIAGGKLLDAISQVADLGFTPQNVLDSASHTHAAPSGYSNYTTYNTVFMTTSTLTQQNVTGALDPVLYAFEVRQLALALRRANADLAPGTAGWGSTQLVGLTQNRSLEAHLADYGVSEPYGAGTVAQDPGGYVDTIDPDVQLLRVDKTVGGRSVPVGTWETFADHGTVNKATWLYYNADHHGTADRVVEDTLRREGGVPATQEIVSAYGNGDEGDQTAGIAHSGPADADYVGGVEAQAFLTAWRTAGKDMSSSLALGSRWTQTRMATQPTSGGGPTADDPVAGLPLFTGSEEGRGPLYETTGQQFEGQHLPADNVATPGQGDKIQVRLALPDTVAMTAGMAPSVPVAVPLLVLRIGDRAIASIPGEMTVTMGQRLRATLLPAVASLGINHVVIAGLANEYLSYFTTPEEYQAQHYEGGSSMYGEFASYRLLDVLTDLGKRLASGAADPPPDSTDLRNGVTAAGTAPSGTGATSATATAQPATTQRLQQAVYTWQGGPGGLDLPVDTATSPGHAFVTIRRMVGGAWIPVTDDLGTQIYWGVDGNGVYTAHWEVPLDATLGSYDMLVTANHYTLTSSPFTVTPSLRLAVTAPSAGSLHVGYPAAAYNSDITFRPADIAGGRVSGVAITGATAPGTTVAAGAAQDAFGNCNGTAFGTTGTVTACPALSTSTGTPAAGTGTAAASAAASKAGASRGGAGARKGTAARPAAPLAARQAAPATAARPSRSLAATGLPAGLGALALLAVALGLVLLRHRSAGHRRAG